MLLLLLLLVMLIIHTSTVCTVYALCPVDGMREEMRVDRVYHYGCSRPSPNQHGFEEYISELDGPESPRYTFLLRNSELHSKGKLS